MVAIAIIPCRMGSVRIPGKNLCEISSGLSLVQQAINCAKESGSFRDVVLTSDDDSVMDHVHGMSVFLRQPPTISGPQSDISVVVQWALQRLEPADHVAVLQPAVLARSPRIVKACIDAMEQRNIGGIVTMSRSHPWVWTVTGGGWGHCGWDFDAYPRSQVMPPTFCEINAVQATTWQYASDGHRWRKPLAIAEIPSWSQCLDIDTPADLAEARAIWPALRPLLDEWTPPIHVLGDIACE